MTPVNGPNNIVKTSVGPKNVFRSLKNIVDKDFLRNISRSKVIKPLSANLTKWSNTLKQFLGISR